MKVKHLSLVLMGCLFLLCSTASFGAKAKQNTDPNKIQNPGFEMDKSGIKNQRVIKWSTISEKDKDADFTESGWTHSGKTKLTHWKAKDFTVYTYQTVTKLPEGVYNFEFWYANGDGAIDCYVELKDFGGEPIKIPIERSGSWIKKEVKDIKITSGKCTVGIYTQAKGGYWINLDDFLLYNQQDMQVVAEARQEKGPQNVAVINAGFEEGENEKATGWQHVSARDIDAAKRENQGTHSGQYKLTHWKDRDYQVYTYQSIKNLKKNTYTLEFWYANGGGQKNCFVEVKDFGGETIKETLPTNSKWTRVRIPNIKVTNGNCTIGINTDAKANYWINLDDFALYPGVKYDEAKPVKFIAPESTLAIKGMDISTLPQVEAGGGKFYNHDGEPEDLFKILKANGVNYIRLRIWNNPKNGICGKASTLAMAKRIKKAGMGFLLDFHYSDTWADPGKQYKPAAWKDLDFEGLNRAVYDYTKEIITALNKQGTLPDMVQIGNEITSGMLFPDGKLTTLASFNKLARLINSGIKAVKDATPVGKKIKIAIHLDKGGDNNVYTWFFDNLIANGATDFDIIALSYYIAWHGTPTDLYRNLCNLANKYKKDLIVVETAFPFCLNDGDGLENIMAKDEQLKNSGYVPTIAGQKQYLQDIFNIVKHVPDGRGLGVFYWEGAWLPVQGAGWDPNDPQSKNAWENQILFNYEGYALDSLKAFQIK
ncbi:MAG TPA: glycosyl hydrolase 53 family protein [Bacillota bacterium]